MTPAEIAKLPTPRTEAVYWSEQAETGETIQLVMASNARTLEQQLAAAVMALEVLVDIALVTNSNYALDQANRALETLAAIKEKS